MKKGVFILVLLLLFVLTMPLFVFANPDLNNDGNVDVSDLIIVAKNFGLTAGFQPEADTDNNSVVDIFDVVYVASRFGEIISLEVSYWSFDGNTLDTWGDNDCVVHGATFTSDSVSGSALKFDGINDFLDCGNSYSGITSQISILAWVRTAHANKGAVVEKWFYDPTPERSFVLAIYADGSINYVLSSDGNYPPQGTGDLTTQPVITYQWTHLAMVSDGTSMRAYVNGDQVGSVPAPQSIHSSPKNLHIGAWFWGESDSTHYFNGIIDEVKIFRTALSQQEIINEMGTTPPPPPPPPPEENIVNAASLSAADIQDAVDSASPGDVVLLPAGNIQWGSSDVVTVTKSVEIRGMGKDNTILKKNGGDSSRMFRFDCSSNPKVGFSKIKLIGSDGITTSDFGINLFNDCKDFKIYDSHFEGFGNAAIFVMGEPKGVIYNCDFIDNFMDGLGYGIAVIGKDEWPTPEYGSDNWPFIEDCYFEGSRHAVASGQGGRYVFRHNTVTRTYTTNHAVDTHGQRNINQRGTRAFEIYENLIDETENPGVPHGIGLRGGDGVVFNNDIRNVNMPIYFKGEPPTRFDGECPWTTADYPAFDQSQDVYFWGNTEDGQAITSIDKVSYCGYDILYEEGRDYYMYARPGYTPYTYPHPLRNS